MTNSPYGFGFPGISDTLGALCGKGDRAVYARADSNGFIYLETNGGPVELLEEESFEEVCYDNNAAWAIYSLALRLVYRGKGELADFIAGNLSFAGRDDMALLIKCALKK